MSRLPFESAGFSKLSFSKGSGFVNRPKHRKNKPLNPESENKLSGDDSPPEPSADLEGF